MRFLRSLRATPETLVLAIAVPVLTVNPAYAPGVAVAVGSASVTVETGDIAMVAVVAATFVAARRLGFGPLVGAKPILIPAGLLVLGVLAATVLGPQLSEGYPLATKAVSAAKFLEYALLALAVPLIVRTADDVKLVAAFVVATSLAATTWGLLQIIGLVSNFDRVPAGRRMPSFAGYHDFAILSGLSLALAIGAIALGHPRSLRVAVWLAAVSGVIGMVIAGALSAVLAVLFGIGFAFVAMVVKSVVTRGSVVALAAVTLTLLAGSAVMRSGDAADFVGFLGSNATTSTGGGVESYSQRTVLSYIGLRMFLDHPATGVGWQGSDLFVNAAPYLGDVRRRFPDVTDEALPSAEHSWGVQNAYVQAAADMGIVGLVTIVWLVLAAIGRPARATLSRTAPAAALALAVTVGALVCALEWAALGLVAGGPATAFIWFTIGSAIAVRPAASVP